MNNSSAALTLRRRLCASRVHREEDAARSGGSEHTERTDSPRVAMTMTPPRTTPVSWQIHKAQMRLRLLRCHGFLCFLNKGAKRTRQMQRMGVFDVRAERTVEKRTRKIEQFLSKNEDFRDSSRQCTKSRNWKNPRCSSVIFAFLRDMY